MLVVVGAGPKGVGLLERIAANAPELLRGRLTVHLLDPFPPGPGRVWRFAALRGEVAVAVRATVS